MTTIDFAEWTDAQLEVGARFTSSPNYPPLAAEIQRRKKEGVWLKDGSKERVAEFAKSVRTTRRRKTRQR